MPKYRRPARSNCPVFFTVCLADRTSSLLIDQIDLLRQAVKETVEQRPFDILSWVVLPDHMHAIWQLPPEDPDYSQRWGAIKSRFVRALRKPGFSPEEPSQFPRIRQGKYAGQKPGLRASKREAAIWQRRFWEHHCRHPDDLRRHLEYCWWNPVKHGLVESPTDWSASSIHRDIRRGFVDPFWQGKDHQGQFGEAA